MTTRKLPQVEKWTLLFLFLNIATRAAHCLCGSQTKPNYFYPYISSRDPKIAQLWLWPSCSFKVTQIHFKTHLQENGEKKKGLAELIMLRVTKSLKKVPNTKKISVLEECSSAVNFSVVCFQLVGHLVTQCIILLPSEQNCQYHCRGYCNIFVHTYLDK